MSKFFDKIKQDFAGTNRVKDPEIIKGEDEIKKEEAEVEVEDLEEKIEAQVEGEEVEEAETKETEEVTEEEAESDEAEETTEEAESEEAEEATEEVEETTEEAEVAEAEEPEEEAESEEVEETTEEAEEEESEEAGGIDLQDIPEEIQKCMEEEAKADVPVETDTGPTKPRWRSMDFYAKIGEYAYQADRQDVVDPVLRSFIVDLLNRRPDILDAIIKPRIEEYMARKPEERIPDVEAAIQRIANQSVTVGVRFINKADPEVKETFPTWEDAVASIQHDIDVYGIDPEGVFETHYYLVEDPMTEVAKEDVANYINKFRGDKDALKEFLHWEQ